MAKKSETGVEVKNPAAVGEVFDYGEHKRGGFENQTAADLVIPFLTLLQDLSPQTKKMKPEYIEGAEPGMLINSATGEIYKVPLIFVPCITTREFLEWLPRNEGGGGGKGYRGSHTPESELVRLAKDEAEKAGSSKFKLFHPVNKNIISETFTMFGYILNSIDATTPSEPIAISFWSTKIPVYKKFNYRLSTFKEAPDAPLYAHRVAISTVFETRDSGDSYNYVLEGAVEDDLLKGLIPPTLDGKPHPMMVKGKEFSKLILSGAARAAHETRQDDEEDAAPVGVDGKKVF